MSILLRKVVGLCRQSVSEFSKSLTTTRNGSHNVHVGLPRALQVLVRTGDRTDAGSDANVSIVVHDDRGNSSRILLDNLFRNDLQRGSEDTFTVNNIDDKFGTVSKIEIWRDNYGLSPSWYVDSIRINDKRPKAKKNVIHFPIQRWIRDKHKYVFMEYDCSLPQNDKNKQQRKYEIDKKRSLYQFEQKLQGSPAQVKLIPGDELFSDQYKWDILRNKLSLITAAKLTKFMTLFDEWDSLDDIEQLYSADLGRPSTVDRWKDDKWFGAQRLCGCNPNLISLCKEIPKNFDVTEEMVSPFLEGLSLHEALHSRKLFIVDLKILENLPCNAKTLDALTVTKLLSMKGTNSLGDFEVQYLYDRRCLEAVKKFRSSLRSLSDVYKKRNKSRDYNYDYLDPDVVPNSISI